MSLYATQDEKKQAAAKAALKHLPKGGILGVGTGSTVNFLIDLLPELQLEAAVASSQATADRLKKLGIEVVDMNHVGSLDAYVDGADEIDRHMHMIKGGGGALTREKIVAAVARKFICITDQSKLVNVLGNFPLPVEVIPMARSYVAREIVHLGGHPALRRGVRAGYRAFDFILDLGQFVDEVIRCGTRTYADDTTCRDIFDCGGCGRSFLFVLCHYRFTVIKK